MAFIRFSRIYSMALSAYEQLKQKLLQEPHTWLITGVAGFIGSNLLEQLLRLNQKVIGLDNFVTGFRKNIQEVLNSLPHVQQQNFSFYEGDICSITDCTQVMDGVEYVLHQAALGSVPRSIQLPEATHAVNTTGFLNILIAAKNAKVKRFVYASSSSVYGDSPHLPKKEANIGQPLSPYAVSKYTNELYAQAFSTCYGLNTIGLRYFNVFGPRQHPEGPYAAVIPRWTHALLNREPICIYGDGKTSRDFCYVKNAIQANLLAATTENSQAINTVYNIAFGEQNTLNSLYSTLIEILDLHTQQKVIYQDFRSGDIRHSLADILKARTLLGYAPQYGLESGLKEMVNWYRAVA